MSMGEHVPALVDWPRHSRLVLPEGRLKWHRRQTVGRPRIRKASDKPSDNDSRQHQMGGDPLRHRYPSGLRQSYLTRCQQTKSACIVRRRSTVRLRNGAPGQRNNSNVSNRPLEPFWASSSRTPDAAFACSVSPHLREVGKHQEDELSYPPLAFGCVGGELRLSRYAVLPFRPTVTYLHNML
jgi:hypothetical protein